MIRLPVVDLPDAAPTGSAASPVRRRTGVASSSTFEPDERSLALSARSTPDSPGLALGTAQGVVKRVVPDYPANRDDFEVIGLKDGDTVVGAVELPPATRTSSSSPPTPSCCASRPPSSARRAGRRAAWPGVRLDTGATG